MINYEIFEEKKTMENEDYLTYGIVAMSGEKEELRIGDISPEKEAVMHLAKLCNDEKLEVVHLQAVVEDYLAQRGIIFY